MYVIRTHTIELADKRYVSTDYLMEMTKRELREAEAEAPDSIEYNVIPADLARRYVARGMTHMTGLYINENGRVRYARSPEPAHGAKAAEFFA